MGQRLQIILVVVTAGIFLLAFKAPWVDFEKNSENGIAFENISFEVALQKAKNENKTVFVDFYATWCGPCKMMKKLSFSSKKVGQHFNKTHINLAIDIDTAEGKLLAKKYQIREVPTLLILDVNGYPKNRTSGFQTGGALVAFSENTK